MTRCWPAATSVVGLSRDPAKARLAKPGVDWHSWEPTLERPPAAAFDGVDGVVNLVGEKIDQRWTDEAKKKIMETRRTGTHNLVGTIAGLERRPAVLVNQSAVGYYGDRGDATSTRSPRPRRRQLRLRGRASSGSGPRTRSRPRACAWSSSVPARSWTLAAAC